MTQIKADILCDSVAPNGKRLTTYVCTFNRWILAEVNTHRVLSRNTASSRAIPTAKMIEQVRLDPAGPYRWGKPGSGMQDHGWWTDEVWTGRMAAEWKQAAMDGALHAMWFEPVVAKQVVNRLLEPFAWSTALISGTNWDGFFRQRVHRDAQPELQRLAHLMLRAYVASQPTPVAWGEWHVPFGDRMPVGLTEGERLRVAVARCARVSYLTHDGQIDLAKDLGLFDRLIVADPQHLSPAEHVAKADPDGSGNFGPGWRQLRADHERHEPFDAAEHLAAYEAEINEGMATSDNRH